MKRKTVFACEGKNDGFFLESVLERLGYDTEDISFYSTQQKKKKKQREEIDKFISPHSPDRVKCFLIKNEGGKKEVTAFLNNNITPTFLGKQHSASLIVLLDSDIGIAAKYKEHRYKKNAKSFIEKIKKTFSNSRPNINFTCNELQIVDDALIQSIEIELKNKKDSFKFYIIFFKKTLEQLAKIIKEDPPEKKKEKISRYVKKSNYHDLFKNLGIQDKKL